MPFYLLHVPAFVYRRAGIRVAVYFVDIEILSNAFFIVLSKLSFFLAVEIGLHLSSSYQPA